VPRPSGDLGGGQVQRAGEMSLPPARPATGVDEHEAGIARGERGVDIGDVGLEREACGEEGDGVLAHARDATAAARPDEDGLPG
jgi:hypothetical protein